MAPTPTPAPLESGGGGGPMETVGSMGGQMGTISLGVLIQYINQRTYSDLLNLAEILPRKSDLEKKIDIVQYAQRTRQLYVRLLALVKWAASASKVDKCCHIMALLEKQNNLFTYTADKLYHMTKENLVCARLPHFHIPAAVETLTTGSYDRLPLTIRQRILPPEPITALERKQTLTRLEQIIQHRLVTTELPPQMRTSRIENGRVKFTVEHEFEVSLTLMGDSITEPWRLLEIEILVEDKETGDGKALVHRRQVLFIHHLIQSRLQDNPKPLHETYMVLHSFCQALQLEVLFVQTQKLLEDRLDFHIRIEEYLQGRSLTLTYWRELTQRDPSAQLGYRLTVQVDPTEPSKPLMVLHTPSLGSKESEIAERAIRSDHLSIERLLVHTIYLRTKIRLSELKQEMDSKLGNDAEKCQLSGSPAVLHVPILQPNLRSEQLLITVDTHTGVLLPHIPQYDNCHIISDLQSALNHDKSKVDDLISELRYWLMVRRTEKTLQHLPATAHERLPLMYFATHPLNSLGKHKVFITFHKHPGYVVIVEFSEKEGSPCEIEQSLYFMVVKQASIEDNPNDDTVQTALPKSYMRAYDLVKLDSFVCTHGPSTKVDVIEPGERALGGKRKLQQRAEPASKRVKVPAYFLPDVAQCVAMSDMKLPLTHLSLKLRERSVFNTGEQVEEGGMGVLLRLIDLPSVEGLSSDTVIALRKNLLSSSIRIQVPQFKGSRVFGMEYLFTNCPVTSQHSREQGPRRAAYFTYEVTENVSSTVDAILADWTVISQLYQLVLTFAAHLSASRAGVESAGSSSSCSSSGANPKSLSEMVRVKSFNYKSMTLAYGPSYDAFVIIRYNAEKKKVGMYYSTPIYQFRMKCHLCDNHFEIKTDPANLDYVIVSGARRQERRWDPTENEQVVPEDKGVTRKMAADAMFRLEHGVDDKNKSKKVDLTLRQLEEFQTERWFDDYGANRAMRAAMRVKRNEAQAQEAKDASYNFLDPLLPPDDNDAKLAKLLQLTQSKTSDQLHNEKRTLIDAQSVFARLKHKKISPSSKKAYARQSLTGIITQSQKNFSNFKNSGATQNLGIIPKKVCSGMSSSHLPQEDEGNREGVDPQTASSTHKDKQECSTSPLSNNMTLETSPSNNVPDSATYQSRASQSCSGLRGNLSSQNTPSSLVGYECSTSDSD